MSEPDIKISFDDLKMIIGIIQICFDRYAFKENEKDKIHSLNQKLLKLLNPHQFIENNFDQFFEIDSNVLNYDNESSFIFLKNNDDENFFNLPANNENTNNPIQESHKNLSCFNLETIFENENEYRFEKKRKNFKILNSILE